MEDDVYQLETGCLNGVKSRKVDGEELAGIRTNGGEVTVPARVGRSMLTAFTASHAENVWSCRALQLDKVMVGTRLCKGGVLR